MPMKSGEDKTRCKDKFSPPQNIATMKGEIKCSTIADNFYYKHKRNSCIQQQEKLMLLMRGSF